MYHLQLLSYFVLLLCPLFLCVAKNAPSSQALIHRQLLAKNSSSTIQPAPIVIPGISSPEVAHHRNYFYVGGQYENATDGSGTVRTGQIYVEQLITQNTPRKRYPLVFWHGAAQSGTNWLNTPDGREGWASYFLRKGYVVYLVDQPQRGRSPWELSQGDPIYLTVEIAEGRFTAPEAFNLYPQSAFHTQFPGTGQRGDPIFDQFYASQLQYQANDTSFSGPLNRAAGVALLDIIGPSILITHSQAGPYGWEIGDAYPDNVVGILAIEPEGPPFQNANVMGNGSARPYGVATQPLAYDPPISTPADLIHQQFAPAAENLTACQRQAEPARKLVNLAKIPTMVMTSQASNHAAYDYCTALYLQQAGLEVEIVNLTAQGILGNGHFMFLELNNLDIAPIAGSFFERVSGENTT